MFPVTRSRNIRLIIFAAAVSSLAAACYSQPSFQGLGYLPGLLRQSNGSYAQGISADGTTVVGQSDGPNGYEAFKWTLSGGMIGLGGLPGADSSNYGSEAFTASAGGSVVIGTAPQDSFSEIGSAFKWTQEDGMVKLGSLGGFDDYGVANQISDDGAVIAGYARALDSMGNSLWKAFRWTNQTGMTELGDPISPDYQTYAIWISPDGATLGVSAEVNGVLSQNYFWDAASGFTPISDPIGVRSRDGQVVAYADSGKIFRWTQQTGPVQIYQTTPFTNSWVRAISADGSIIVGAADYDANQPSEYAFIWDETNGTRRLDQVLLSYGADLKGFQLIEASAISADGTAVAGNGFNKAGYAEAWAARLPHMGPLRGDTNGDGCIDDFDLTNVILDFGGAPRDKNILTDITGPSDAPDGIVDDFDLTYVIVHFLEGC